MSHMPNTAKTPTAAVVSKDTSTYNAYVTAPVGWEGTFPTVGVSNYIWY